MMEAQPQRKEEQPVQDEPVRLRTEELQRINARLGEEITRHEQTERALSESAERLSAMIAAAPEAVLVIDAAGSVEEWNPQAERTFGWSRGEVRGRQLSALIMPERFRAAHDQGMARYIATREPRILNRTIELAAVHRDGHEFPIELSVWPIQAGPSLRFGAFIRDIGARKAIERSVQDRSARALRFRDALYQLARLNKTDFDIALAVILETAARVLDVERVSYWSLSVDTQKSERSMVYVKSRAAFEGAAAGAELDARRFPQHFSALASHQPVVAHRVHEDPATSEFADSHLRPLGIVALLDTGVWFQGRMAGVLRNGHVGASREWQADEIEFATAIAAVISVALEASQRHAVTLALQASEEKYRVVVDNASEAIVVAQDGFIRFANPAAIAMSGLSRDEYYATPFLDLIHPEDRDRVVARHRARMQGETVENRYVFRIVNRQGGVRSLQINAVPISWEGGPATLNFLADITEREQLQEHLEESLIEREAILQTSVVGIVFTRDRVIHWINRTLEEQMLGYAAGELVGQSTAVCYATPDEFARYGEDAYQQIAAGRTWSCEMQMRRRDGSLFWCLESGRAIDPTDISRGAIWVMTDVTRRREADEEMRRALEQERELSLLKSRFVAMTSHEFRTPLATILSATELLEKYGDRLPGFEKEETLGLIKTAVGRMTSMLEDVLLIGKADAGRMQCSPRQLDVVALAHQLIDEAGQAAHERRAVRLVVDSDCAGRRLDEKLIRHILSNLLSNALKYSAPDGDVELRVGGTAEAVHFQVNDHGIGIPQADQARLFSSFHRGGNVSNISGTGLGLAIVKKCVDAHGGTIACTSEVGRGTTFAVTIPDGDDRLS